MNNIYKRWLYTITKDNPYKLQIMLLIKINKTNNKNAYNFLINLYKILLSYMYKNNLYLNSSTIASYLKKVTKWKWSVCMSLTSKKY